MSKLPVQRDWENREFVELVKIDIVKITEFLTTFDIGMRQQLAVVNEKLKRVERKMDFLEARYRTSQGQPATSTEQQYVADAVGGERPPQGIYLETISPGDNLRFPRRGQMVMVHYTGTLEDGSTFDSTIGQDPFEFTLGANQVVAGWEDAIMKMSVGERAKVTIPPELAYGAQGGGVIPPNSTLFFEMELVKILS